MQGIYAILTPTFEHCFDDLFKVTSIRLNVTEQRLFAFARGFKHSNATVIILFKDREEGHETVGNVPASMRGAMVMLIAVLVYGVWPLVGVAAQSKETSVGHGSYSGPALNSSFRVADVATCAAGVTPSVAAKDGKAAAAKEMAKKETERVNQAAAAGLCQRVDEKSKALNTEQEQRKRYMIYGGVAFLALLFLSFLLWSKRKRDLRTAEAEIEAADARFKDRLLEGADSAGAPLALRVSGRDLMKSAAGLVFGRDPDLADILIADDTVSHRHARIMVRDYRLYLEDLGSTGGSASTAQHSTRRTARQTSPPTT